MNIRHTIRRKAALNTRVAATNYLPLTSPQFNVREIAKQMVLLEDHLRHKDKVCPDCIRKHLLAIEAYAEEACSLDETGIWTVCVGGLAGKAREWQCFLADTPEALRVVANQLRTFRKKIVPLVFDPRGPEVRVASVHEYRSQHFCQEGMV